MSDMMIFSGNATSDVAKAIAQNLDMPLGNAHVGKFSDGETAVEILENVRGRDVFIIQSTCPPANDHLMELIIIADALRRASAGRITAVIPYFGYGRQDRRPHSQRVPISAKVVADMLATAGVDRVVTVDLHAEQIQGFFHIPLDNVYGNPIMLEDIRSQKMKDVTVVSPDIGGVVRARALAKSLGADLAIIDKRRPRANEAQVMHIIGDIKDRQCIIIDDIVDTAGTLCKAAQALIEEGAKSVYAYCIHPIFSGEAISNINDSLIDKVVVTDTIPLNEKAAKLDKIKVLTIAPMLSEAIRRIHSEESVSTMFAETEQ